MSSSLKNRSAAGGVPPHQVLINMSAWGVAGATPGRGVRYVHILLESEEPLPCAARRSHPKGEHFIRGRISRLGRASLTRSFVLPLLLPYGRHIPLSYAFFGVFESFQGHIPPAARLRKPVEAFSVFWAEGILRRHKCSHVWRHWSLRYQWQAPLVFRVA